MGFKLLNVNKFIKEKNAKPVTTPNTFNKKTGIFKPDPEGLYSKQIFGYILKEQSEKYGYIDLKNLFIHPLLFKNLDKINSIFNKVVNDQVKVEIINGELIESENGKTGLDFIIQNFDKIDFDLYKKPSNSDFIEFLKKVQKNLIFIDKIPVIPVIYRPYRIKNGRVEEDEITEYYKKILLKTANSSTPNAAIDLNQILATTLNQTSDNKLSIQKNIQTLYDYFIKKLEKKEGYFRSKLIGKRLDNVARLVANAKPDVPIDCAVIPWHVLLNLFDIFVIGYLHKYPEYKKKLNIENYSIQDLGKLFYYIYKNCDIYCKTYPEYQDIWIELLKKIFEENDYLRVLLKRDPGWAATSFWSLKPLIGKGCQYHIVVPSFYYIPLGGDSFNTNIFYTKDKKCDIEFYNKNKKIKSYKIKTLNKFFDKIF